MKWLRGKLLASCAPGAFICAWGYFNVQHAEALAEIQYLESGT